MCMEGKFMNLRTRLKERTLLAFMLVILPAPPVLADMRAVVAEDGTVQFVQVDEGSSVQASFVATAPATASSAVASVTALASAVTTPGMSSSVFADPVEAAMTEAEPGDDGFAEVPPPPPVIPQEKAGDPIAAQFSACQKVSFGDEVLFDTAEHDLKPHAALALDAVAQVLLAHPSIQVRIEGHTDSRGGVLYNQELSEQRANAVYQAFLQRGVSAGQMKAVGYGLTQPTDTNDTDVGRANNRRVDLVPLHC
jgi:outer membrane protein OmpA-like peptidoglycan-associated protein